MRLWMLLAAGLLRAQHPEFVSGDECLFCHSDQIGVSWPKNAHGRTVRPLDPGAAATPPGARFVLGTGAGQRFLKEAGYGRLALWTRGATPGWDTERFQQRCSGCHATAVDPATGTFAASGLDCYVCHGAVDLNHSNDVSLVWLSRRRRDDPEAVIATCAQCHLRGGRSRSTGRPYAAGYTAGGDLFRDWQVDWTAGLAGPDRHVFRSARDVREGGVKTTCLSCHRVHAASTGRHRRLPQSEICRDCHFAEGPKSRVRSRPRGSPVCDTAPSRDTRQDPD